MQIADLLDPFADFTAAFPNGRWEVIDGIVHFITNEYLEDEHLLAGFREMFL